GFSDDERPRASHRKPQRLSRLRARSRCGVAGGVFDLRALRLGRRDSGGTHCAEPHGHRARLRLRAKALRRRNHRHLRALPAGSLKRTQPAKEKMSLHKIKPDPGRPLSPVAIALMLMLCISWGFNQIAVKLALPDIPAMTQALFRSIGALPVLLIVGWIRGVKFFERDGSFWPGVLAGILFSFEFVLIYQGLRFTTASRAVVFLYTAPFFVSLGSFRLLGERLRA